jgi:hypothetical protein
MAFFGISASEWMALCKTLIGWNSRRLTRMSVARGERRVVVLQSGNQPVPLPDFNFALGAKSAANLKCSEVLGAIALNLR